jgi:ubiquinone/menaquinone biosynthesis C-methylase UbiE
MSMEDPYFWLERMIEARVTKEPHKAMYNCHKDEWDKLQASHKKLLAQHIPAGFKVLDVGCGNGMLADCMPAGTVYHGVDLNPYLIAWARRLYAACSSHSFTVSNGRQLPFKDGQFDVCVSRSVVGQLGKDEGFTAVDELFSEIKRVSKKQIMLGLSDRNDIRVFQNGNEVEIR